jgi:predicted transporter
VGRTCWNFRPWAAGYGSGMDTNNISAVETTAGGAGVVLVIFGLISGLVVGFAELSLETVAKLTTVAVVAGPLVVGGLLLFVGAQVVEALRSSR